MDGNEGREREGHVCAWMAFFSGYMGSLLRVYAYFEERGKGMGCISNGIGLWRMVFDAGGVFYKWW